MVVNPRILSQFIDPVKLYNMLDHLKARGNPYYQFYEDINTYRNRLTEEDKRIVIVSVQNVGDVEKRMKLYTARKMICQTCNMT